MNPSSTVTNGLGCFACLSVYESKIILTWAMIVEFYKSTHFAYGLVLNQNCKRLTCRMSRGEVCKCEDQQRSHDSHLCATCIDCGLDCVHLLDVFGPETPVPVSKCCGINGF